MLGGKSWEQWISEYAGSHQHPVNKFFHTVGIPLIATSLPLFVLGIFVRGVWLVASVMFVLGWVFQFIGHWFEGKPPEFLRDPRFLFVGLRWWFAKIKGRV